MASTGKEIVLVTGANTGIGFELSKRLLRDYHGRFIVLVGARTPSKGEAAVRSLQDQGFKDCQFLHVDVDDDDSIALAARQVEQKYGRLDVLHANAGIAPDLYMLGKAPMSEMIMKTMRTNVAGTAQIADAFIPLLQKAENPRVIFMSSGLGSHQRCMSFPNTDWPAYSASKAALNMIMLYYFHRLPDMRVNACCPGLRSTNLNGFGSGIPENLTPGRLEDGTNNAVRLTLLGKDGERGTYTQMDDATGEVRTLPW